ncbi:hypothetical protein GCM10007385_02690 [Tateyamaria omphalii]|nr:hypothetical protein GCM10007385_02690 [Tateyamaria omphalii]
MRDVRKTMNHVIGPASVVLFMGSSIPAASDHYTSGCNFDRRTNISIVFDDVNEEGHSCLNVELNETNEETGEFKLKDGVTLVCQKLEFDGWFNANDRRFELHIENGHWDDDSLVLTVEQCIVTR